MLGSSASVSQKLNMNENYDNIKHFKSDVV